MLNDLSCLCVCVCARGHTLTHQEAMNLRSKDVGVTQEELEGEE